ncbi:hypothetical protein [Streptomyces sp. RG80]|uniref:hypothetical protein n=1 Tax=Streptomyces sp. RG80 TaxID=3157340 RepID=UPI00338E0DE1
MGVGEGVGQGVGQVRLPAAATALIPSGPIEAEAQASAAAVFAGTPTASHVSVKSNNTRMAGAY